MRDVSFPPYLTIPESARFDLAWTEDVYAPAKVGAPGIYFPMSGHYDIVLSVRCHCYAVGAGADRVPSIQLKTYNGEIVYSVPAVSAIPAGASGSATWLYDVDSFSANGYAAAVSPLPGVAIMPDGRFEYGLCDLVTPTDQVSGATLFVLHVPTGPPLQDELANLSRLASPTLVGAGRLL